MHLLYVVVTFLWGVRIEWTSGHVDGRTRKGFNELRILVSQWDILSSLNSSGSCEWPTSLLQRCRVHTLHCKVLEMWSHLENTTVDKCFDLLQNIKIFWFPSQNTLFVISFRIPLLFQLWQAGQDFWLASMENRIKCIAACPNPNIIAPCYNPHIWYIIAACRHNPQITSRVSHSACSNLQPHKF